MSAPVVTITSVLLDGVAITPDAATDSSAPTTTTDTGTDTTATPTAPVVNTSTTTTQTDFAEAVTVLPALSPIPGANLASYASYEDFELRFQNLETVQVSQAKLSNPIEPDKARIEAALDDATSTVDSYLRPKYGEQLALYHANPPGVIINHVCNMARYALASNRPTETQRERYEDAIAWCLLMIKDGQALTTKSGTTLSQTDKSSGVDGDVEVDGVTYRDETYSSNSPAFTSTSRQVAVRQSYRSRRGFARW